MSRNSAAMQGVLGHLADSFEILRQHVETAHARRHRRGQAVLAVLAGKEAALAARLVRGVGSPISAANPARGYSIATSCHWRLESEHRRGTGGNAHFQSIAAAQAWKLRRSAMWGTATTGFHATDECSSACPAVHGLLRGCRVCKSGIATFSTE